MNKQERIDKMTDEALDSLDGANRATPRPYLFTRLAARMERQAESRWENVVRFIARPAVVIAGLFADRKKAFNSCFWVAVLFHLHSSAFKYRDAHCRYYG